MKKYLILGAVLLGAYLGFAPDTTSAATCALKEGGAYRTATNPAVYYITPGCTKMLLNQDQYFSYFTSWNDTQVTSAYNLNRVKNDAGPTTFGPLYFPRTGSLVKSPTSPDVYYVLFFTKNKIASEHIFNAMGFDRNWVETLPQSTMDKLVEGDTIETVEQVFSEGVYLFRYSDSPNKIHLLLPDPKKPGKMLRHHLKNDVLVDYAGYRRDRIPVLSPIYQFQMGVAIDNLEEFFTQYFSDAFAGLFGGFNEDFSSDIWDDTDWNTMEEEWKKDMEDNSYDDFQYSFAPVDADTDHIRGNVDAKITLIEYADLECPFCKMFHGTMKQVMEKYGNDVRWVYRHFPLESLHAQAKSEALATECAAEQGKFWEFTDLIFDQTDSNDTLDLNRLNSYATQVGIDVSTFSNCYKNNRYLDKVDAHIKDATNAGAFGTPHTILVGPNGQVVPIPGSVPFETVEAEILKML